MKWSALLAVWLLCFALQVPAQMPATLPTAAESRWDRCRLRLRPPGWTQA